MSDLKEVLKRLDALEKNLKEEINHVENTVKETLSDFKEKLFLVEEECQFLRKENQIMKEKIDKLEGFSRRNNLIFYGVDEKTSRETWSDVEESVKKCIKDVCELEIGEMEIERAHRVGRKGREIRPVMVKFLNWKTKEWVLKNFRKATKLGKMVKDCKVTIGEDFTEFVKKQRSELEKHMENAKRQGHEDVYLRFDKLFVDGRIFRVDENMKLLLVTSKGGRRWEENHTQETKKKNEEVVETDGKRKREETKSPASKEISVEKKKMKGGVELRKRSDSLQSRSEGERSVRDWLISKK